MGNSWLITDFEIEISYQSKSIVIVSGMAAKLEPAKDYKELTLSPDDEKNQALATNGKYDTYQRRTS
jgi:hypothetical protein